jgi:phosphatidylserine decarboxylase
MASGSSAILSRAAQRLRYLLRNERRINILKTQNFGSVGFVEGGALSVGRIVQVHPLGQPFRRGTEKSVFCFGDSAIVVFSEAGAWRPEPQRKTPLGGGAE